MRIPLCLAAILISLISLAPRARGADKPNIIFILADDLGLDGVSCYGADRHQTPHIDALASSGIRFETCYSAPLCGPSRCVLQTGRYAFRTGGITNQSWRGGGPGARSADEFPIAKLLKQAGYATCQAGKWRQIGETPADWGYDEYLTDPTAGGWYWETHYQQNGKEITLPKNSYAPDVMHNFAMDFVQRHKDKPFFLYYAQHLVHKPTLRTPDSKSGAEGNARLYSDNIQYMDKQVGLVIAELERLGIRNNTLVFFAGDNGTTQDNSSPVHGRLIHGHKATMFEGGSRVPLIASWPAVTPKGKVLPDLVNFTDMYATFAELAGVPIPNTLTFDSQSIAPQLRGQPGSPRAWAFVQLGQNWYVREKGFKLNQANELFDMSDAPFVEKLIAPDADSPDSKLARQRLADVLKQLNPAAGKSDASTGRPNKRRKLQSLAPDESLTPQSLLTVTLNP